MIREDSLSTMKTKLIIAIAIIFIGTAIVVTYAEAPEPAADISFTISAWVNMDDASNFWIVSKGTREYPEYAFGVNASDNLSLTIYDLMHTSTSTIANSTSTYIQAISTSALSSDENTWTHLAAVYTGSATSTGMTLYKNGTVLPHTINASSTYIRMHSRGEKAMLGKLFADGSNYANGLMDNFRMFSRALAPEDIQREYNAGLGTHFR